MTQTILKRFLVPMGGTRNDRLLIVREGKKRRFEGVLLSCLKKCNESPLLPLHCTNIFVIPNEVRNLHKIKR